MLAEFMNWTGYRCLVLGVLLFPVACISNATDTHLRVRFHVEVNLAPETIDAEARLKSLLSSLKASGMSDAEIKANETGLRDQLQAQTKPASGNGEVEFGYGPSLAFGQSLIVDRQGGPSSLYLQIVNKDLYFRGFKGSSPSLDLFKITQMPQGSLRADIFAFTGHNLFKPATAKNVPARSLLYSADSDLEEYPFMVVERANGADVWSRILLFKSSSLEDPAGVIYERRQSGSSRLIRKTIFSSGKPVRTVSATELSRSNDAYGLATLISTGTIMVDQQDGSAPDAQISYRFNGVLPSEAERRELRLKRSRGLEPRSSLRPGPNPWLLAAGSLALAAGGVGVLRRWLQVRRNKRAS